MFEDYLEDAAFFYLQGKAELGNNNQRQAKMYFRASVFCAASALESFINVIGISFSHGNSIDKNEIAFLNDKMIEISPSKGTMEERTKYNSIDSKIKFLIKKFNVGSELTTGNVWKEFLKFKDFRDSLIHPKSLEDEYPESEYGNRIKDGFNSSLEIMNAISGKIFSKPLRKGLNDLKII